MSISANARRLSKPKNRTDLPMAVMCYIEPTNEWNEDDESMLAEFI